MPPRRRRAAPATARELAAYNVGWRLAGFGEPAILDKINRGRPVLDWLTVAEAGMWRITDERTWSRWLWAGWQARLAAP